ncbi:MAG TPA: helix-turn-helix transcriptional regulator [Oscillospiraceae bacterium]|nr:helix-turn-helix transcriptional regulator [Oscillospiraceae bacterium]HPF55862.1 helix-turn-helix transcriptional regulator [Clostridiales bacterium]HPK36434.1 helix-turn-helix transcriptional regulator [Oscillospiraceae bacterium]HPR76381.1 helix-turn-helix transcriptional regulator [Oscillospiraceae bacterium]
MPIIIRLDRMMADRKMSLNELSERVGITIANLSNLKTAKISAVKLSTMEAICKALNCQPGDLFEYREK